MKLGMLINNQKSNFENNNLFNFFLPNDKWIYFLSFSLAKIAQ